MGDDLSSTMRYRRDSFLHFLVYFGALLLPHRRRAAALPRPQAEGGRWRGGASSARSVHHAVIAAALVLDWRFGLVAFVFPYVAVRFMMMVGNWGQHAFINTARENNGHRQLDHAASTAATTSALLQRRLPHRPSPQGEPALDRAAAGLHRQPRDVRARGRARLRGARLLPRLGAPLDGPLARAREALRPARRQGAERRRGHRDAQVARAARPRGRVVAGVARREGLKPARSRATTQARRSVHTLGRLDWGPSSSAETYLRSWFIVKGFFKSALAPASSACAMSSGKLRSLVTRMGQRERVRRPRMCSQSSYPDSLGKPRSMHAMIELGGRPGGATAASKSNAVSTVKRASRAASPSRAAARGHPLRPARSSSSHSPRQAPPSTLRRRAELLSRLRGARALYPRRGPREGMPRAGVAKRETPLRHVRALWDSSGSRPLGQRRRPAFDAARSHCRGDRGRGLGSSSCAFGLSGQGGWRHAPIEPTILCAFRASVPSPHRRTRRCRA